MVRFHLIQYYSPRKSVTKTHPTAAGGHGHDGAPGIGQWIVALGGRELHAIVSPADGVNVVIEHSTAQVLASR